MATVPYVSSSPWWSAANLNTLVSEFDRRLSKALAGKTPYLLANYGVGNATTAGSVRQFFLPISQVFSDPVVKGVGFPSGVMGAVYCFKGAGTVIYLDRTTNYSQTQMDTDAAASTETSRDTVAKVMVVDDSAATLSLEWSLIALTRTDGADTFWLAPETVGGRRAMRKHRYAVAEIVLEGQTAFTIPREWNRYANFRLHNLSPATVDITVQTRNADGSNGSDQTFTVAKFGCKSFRREDGYFDNSLTYLWKARAGIDKRFCQSTGAWVVEQSAKANPISNPNVILDWMEKLGATRDPYVDPPDEYARYTALFGDPASGSTKIHDLIAHKGACKSIGFQTDNTPVETSGTVGGTSTLIADMAAIGITVTVTGGTYAMARVSTGGPGDDSMGIDLFCNGSNVLWCQAQSVAVPGHGSASRAQKQCQYSTMPVTLVEDVPIGALESPSYTGNSDAGKTLHTLTRTIYGATSTYGTTYGYSGTHYTGSDYTVTRLSQLSDAGDTVTNAHDSIVKWQLTPLGFAGQWSYSFTVETMVPSGAGFQEPFNGGIYQRWSGATVSRKAWLHIKSPGWLVGSLKPTRGRVFGMQDYTAGSPAFWSTPDWSGILSSTTGVEPTATGKVLIEYPSLKYLTDGTATDRGDVYDNTVADMTETRYKVMAEFDEARSVVDEISEARRVQYNAGTATAAPGSPADTWFVRRPMQIEDYNTLAWNVNAWTRSSPLVTIKNVWLKRTNATSFPGLYIPPFEWQIPGNIGSHPRIPPPKNCAWGLSPGYPTTNWTKANWAAILSIEDREDLPNWATMKANYKLSKTVRWDAALWYKDKYVVETPPGSGYGLIYANDYAVAAGSTVLSTTNGYAGSDWDFSGVDSNFYWVTTESVQTLATAYGLPYVHLVWGEAEHGLSIPPPTTTSVSEIQTGGLSLADSFSPPGTPDLSDEFVYSYYSDQVSPLGIANFLAAVDEDHWDYTDGAAYSADETSGVPNGEEAPRHRGVPSYNSVRADQPSPTGMNRSDWMDDGQALCMSESILAVGVNAVFSGFTDGVLNTRLLIGNQYTRALSNYNPFTGARSGGGWAYTSTITAQELSPGFTYFCPTAAKEHVVRMISDPYVDLVA